MNPRVSFQRGQNLMLARFQLFDGTLEVEGYIGFICGVGKQTGPYRTKTNVLFVQFFSDGQPQEEMYRGGYVLYQHANGGLYTN